MACNCIEQSKLQQQYEYIKQIAIRYSNNQNKEVYIFKLGENYNFSETEKDSENIKKAIEFILPLQ
jgi:hypothetical protein